MLVRIFDSPSALRAAAGEHLGHSEWHRIDQARITAFAEATGDLQWIHTDPERARLGPFGTTIAHGFLTLSLVPLLTGEVYRVDGVRMAVNYGLNRVRFPAPVPVDSQLRAAVLVQAVEEIPDGLQVTNIVTVELEGATKPACVAETVSRFYL